MKLPREDLNSNPYILHLINIYTCGMITTLKVNKKKLETLVTVTLLDS